MELKEDIEAEGKDLHTTLSRLGFLWRYKMRTLYWDQFGREVVLWKLVEEWNAHSRRDSTLPEKGKTTESISKHTKAWYTSTRNAESNRERWDVSYSKPSSKVLNSLLNASELFVKWS